MSTNDPGVKWWNRSVAAALAAVGVGLATLAGGGLAIAAMGDGWLTPEQLAPWRPAVISGAVAMLVLLAASGAMFARYCHLSRPTSHPTEEA